MGTICKGFFDKFLGCIKGAKSRTCDDEGGGVSKLLKMKGL